MQKRYQSHYFSISEVLSALETAKSSSEDYENMPYWSNIITFKFLDTPKTLRVTKTGTARYITVFCTIGSKTEPLKFTTGKNTEICLGNILLPENSEEFEQLKLINPEAKGRLETLKFKPNFNINKYNIPVKRTEPGEDRIEQSLENCSQLYKLVEHLSFGFEKSMSTYFNNGTAYTAFIKKAKTTNKQITALEIVKSFDEENPMIRTTGQLILIEDQNKAIRKIFSDPKDILILLHNLVIVAAQKISNCMQEIIPTNAKTNGGCLLGNPYIRCRVDCNELTGLSRIDIFDYEKGKQTKSDILMLINEEPINYLNIQEAIPYGSIIRGEFNLSEICISNFGTSFTVKADKLSITKPDKTVSSNSSSFYDDDDTLAINDKESSNNKNYTSEDSKESDDLFDEEDI